MTVKCTIIRILTKNTIYIRFFAKDSVIVTEVVVVEKEPEVEELVEEEEKADSPCMFLRYGQPQGPMMVVTTCDPSSSPLKMIMYIHKVTHDPSKPGKDDRKIEFPRGEKGLNLNLLGHIYIYMQVSTQLKIYGIS